MATRSEKLNRLVIGTPCSVSREAIQGSGADRFCLRCNKAVYDFEAMTPRQIEARIEANRGRLCARITRATDGRIVTLPSPIPPSSWLERRASPVVSAVVTALLGLGGAAAETSPPEPPEAAAARDRAPQPESSTPPPAASGKGRMGGTVKDEAGLGLPGFELRLESAHGGRSRSTITLADGNFSFDGLEAGTYLLEGSLEGFSPISPIEVLVKADRGVNLEIQVSPIVTEGVLIVESSDSLQELFAESELVVSGVAGASIAIDPDDPEEVRTELRVTSVLKGRHTGKSLFIRHSEGAEWGHLAPGAKILAFLTSEGSEGDRATYVSADYQAGLKVLSEAEMAAYGERIEALARISRRGDPTPVRLVEWLVATAEEPLTRHEATGEIRGALAALADQAESNDISPELAAEQLRGSADSDSSPALLGAYLGEAERERLRRALLSTRGLTEGDFALFKIVRPWAGDAASEWLTRQFRESEPLNGGVARDVMGYLAEELESESLAHLIEESDARLDALVSNSDPEADWKRIEPLIQAEQEQLRDQFRRMLGE